MKQLNKRNDSVAYTIEAYSTCYCYCSCICSCNCGLFGLGSAGNSSNMHDNLFDSIYYMGQISLNN